MSECPGRDGVLAQDENLVVAERGNVSSPVHERVVIALTPCLVDAESLAAMLGVSRATVYKMHKDGTLGPTTVKLGGRRLWRTEEVRRWVAAGCPSRNQWLDAPEGKEAQGLT